MKYLAALARIIDGDGSVVREHSEVDKIEDEGRLVEANRHRLLCDWLVIATHVPLQGATRLATAALFQTKLFPYSSYAIGAKIGRGSSPWPATGTRATHIITSASIGEALLIT